MSYKSFIDFLIKKQEIKPPDLYTKLDWSRQLFHDYLHDRWKLKCEDLHLIRESIGMSRTKFYKYVQQFFDPR